jgi:hypothetical protein
MTSTTVQCRPEGPPIAAPMRPDGQPYRFEMIHDGGRRRTYADDFTELAAALIPGYAGLDGELAQAKARIRHAVSVQVATQAAINVKMGTASCTPEEGAVLTADRAVPPAVAQWAAPVPLVLVDSFYAPFTAMSRPVAQTPGRIFWLSPGTESDHLRALAALGVITLSEHRPADPANGS